LWRITHTCGLPGPGRAKSGFFGLILIKTGWLKRSERVGFPGRIDREDPDPGRGGFHALAAEIPVPNAGSSDFRFQIWKLKYETKGDAVRSRSSMLDWVLVALAVAGLAGALLSGCDRTIKDDTSWLPESIG
jgi:hypothetical protein